jgi:hypothetical protein
VVERNADARQEGVAEAGDERLAEHPGVASGAHGSVDRGEHGSRVAVEQRGEQVVGGSDAVVDAPRCDHLVESRQRVAGRAGAGPQDVGQLLLRDVEPGVLDDPAHVLLELGGGDEVQLVVLGAALDRRQHLVRVGSRQHEDDVRRGLLEGLEQGSRCRRCELVDLVEDVHLGAARRAQAGLADEVAHGLDAVVRRGVELMEVEARPGLDRPARIALEAGFAVDRALAVQGLGEDPGARGLAGPPRAAEEVRVADPVVAHRVVEGRDQMGLPPDLAEAPGPVPAVEGLVGGHAAADATACRRFPVRRGDG